MPVERKLAAIMFTDIAGFTALSAKDENKALKLLDKQKQLLTPIIEEFNGTLHKEIGDGLLLTFPTVTDAVKCGIEIQEKTKEAEDLNLRIGIHEGEITLKDGDALGDDVNIASRIESYAAVGGIAITGKIQQNISSLPEFETKFISQPSLKGVRQEVKVYCITSHGLPLTEITKVTAKLEKDVKKLWFNQKFIISAVGLLAIAVIGIYSLIPKERQIPSIAILMMENLGSEEDEFWARGITEDLIIKVAGAGLIRVVPIKEILEIDTQESFKEIAKRLNVKYILTSSMHKKKDGFDLRCQLINAKSGVSEYANKWSEPLANSPMIVGNLADDILKTLDVYTTQNIAKAPTANPDAYEFYLKGEYRFKNRQNDEDVKVSQSLITKALDLDENILEAKLLLGDIFKYSGEYKKAVSIYKETLAGAQDVNDSKNIRGSIWRISLSYEISGDTASVIKPFLLMQLKNSRKNGNRIQELTDLYALVDFGLYSFFGKGSSIDSAIFYCKQAISVAENYLEQKDVMHAYAKLGSTYLNSNTNIDVKYEKASRYCKKALKISKEINDIQSMVYYKESLIRIDFKLKKYEEAFPKIEKLYELAKKEEDTSKIITVMRCYSDYYKETNNIKKAKEYFQEYYELSKSEGYNKDQSASKFYRNIGDFEKAEYHLLKYTQTMIEKNQYVQAYRGTVWFYRNLAMFDKSLLYNDKAIDKCREVNDYLQLSYFIQDKGITYQRLGLNELAQSQFIEALSISQKYGMWIAEKQIRFQLIDFYISIQDSVSAQTLINKSIVKSEKHNDIKYQELFISKNGYLSFALGDYKNAIDYFESYVKGDHYKKLSLIFYATWAEAEIKLNNHDKAKGIIQNMLNDYPDNPKKGGYESQESLWKLYKIFNFIGEAQKAKETLQQAKEKMNFVKTNLKNTEYRNSFLNTDVNKQIIEAFEKI